MDGDGCRGDCTNEVCDDGNTTPGDGCSAVCTVEGGPATGAELYAGFCAFCHGDDARGGITGEDVRGASANEISKAIFKETDMNFLMFLSKGEIGLISDYLRTLDEDCNNGDDSDCKKKKKKRKKDKKKDKKKD